MAEELNNELIEQFKEQRIALLQMIQDLERIKVKVETLFPEQLDNRQVYRFQEKVKAVTELFKSILDIRKEIMKSVKDEIELRRKFEGPDNEDDVLNDTDIKKLAEKLEGLMKQKNPNKATKDKLKIFNPMSEEM